MSKLIESHLLWLNLFSLNNNISSIYSTINFENVNAFDFMLSLRYSSTLNNIGENKTPIFLPMSIYRLHSIYKLCYSEKGKITFDSEEQ